MNNSFDLFFAAPARRNVNDFLPEHRAAAEKVYLACDVDPAIREVINDLLVCAAVGMKPHRNIHIQMMRERARAALRRLGQPV